MEILDKVEKRGGKREGAGRKPSVNARNIRASFMLSQKSNDTLEKLAKEKGTSKNDIINNILEGME